MSIVKVATNFNIDIEFAAPPFYRRLIAWVSVEDASVRAMTNSCLQSYLHHWMLVSSLRDGEASRGFLHAGRLVHGFRAHYGVWLHSNQGRRWHVRSWLAMVREPVRPYPGTELMILL